MKFVNFAIIDNYKWPDGKGRNTRPVILTEDRNMPIDFLSLSGFCYSAQERKLNLNLVGEWSDYTEEGLEKKRTPNIDMCFRNIDWIKIKAEDRIPSGGPGGLPKFGGIKKVRIQVEESDLNFDEPEIHRPYAGREWFKNQALEGRDFYLVISYGGPMILLVAGSVELDWNESLLTTKIGN